MPQSIGNNISTVASTNWLIEVDSIGAFRSTVSPPFPQRHGNWRLTVGDTLIVNLPCGSLINQNDVHLNVKNGVGEESNLIGVCDLLGNLRFEWLASEKCAGSCSFCFNYVPFLSSSLNPQRKMGVVNRVIVSPCLRINGNDLPVESLAMQTVMSRCLGPLDTWISRLQHSTAGLHYNVIHFTPVQVTGESGSCYSLADQLEISPELLPVGSKSNGFDLLKNVIEELETRYGLLSTSDIVLNHTANDTHWIPQHPECGYSERNSPHLQAAIELDIALQEFSLKVAEGHFRHKGAPEVIEDEMALKNLLHLIQECVLNPFRLTEWFTIDIEGALDNFRNVPLTPIHTEQSDQEIQQLLLTECLKSVGVARHKGVCPCGEVTSQFCRSDSQLKLLLKKVQEDLYRRAGETNDCILNSIQGFVRWERIQCRKGKIGKTHWNALVPRYFTPITTKIGETLHLANNGWVMDWDAEKDFAAPGSLVYLSRSLVAWSDCIKLRYGNGPNDCPFLWNLMRKYCVNTAKIFHGIRLDNCHSTPIHVAKYCLLEARKINPNLWVYAELFTGKRETDLKFERELGLNALIRESMQCYNAHNLGWKIQEFGGRPIGALDPIPALERLNGGPCPLFRTPSPSLFFDCTHDNETPQQKRTAVDALPNAAAVAAAASAIGSSRGYDELVPKVLSVVTERRYYHSYQTEIATINGTKGTEDNGPDFAVQARFFTSLGTTNSSISVKGSWDGWKDEIQLTYHHDSWSGDFPSFYYPMSIQDYKIYEYKFIADGQNWFYDPSLPNTRDKSGNVNNTLSLGIAPLIPNAGHFIDARQWMPGLRLPGIMEARKVLNETHHKLGEKGFTEIDVEYRGENILIIARHNPKTHEMCVFFIHTAFTPTAFLDAVKGPITYDIKGIVDEIILEARLIIPEDSDFIDEEDFINGLPSALQIVSHSKEIKSNFGIFNSHYDEHDDKTVLSLTSFLPGSVVVVMSRGYPHLRSNVANAIQDIGSITQGLPGAKISRFEELQAYSYLLYSCDSEEKDRSRGARGCYGLEGFGPLPYAGIAGLVPILDQLRYTDDLVHPLVQNVRAGDWLFEYSADRLDTDKDDAFSGGVVVVLLKVASWLRETSSEPLRYLPRKVLIAYLDWIVSSLYSWVTKRIMSGTPEPLRSCTDPFVIRLILATLQFYSYVPSSPLIHGTNHPSLAAGLPHFSTEYMRAWGRDSFISLKGCLLVPGRYQEAKEEILGFARVMRHGLIPNLLDSGNNPRYNARDATWFFLQSVQDYCSVAPEGSEFLKVAVSLKYNEVVPFGTKIETLADLVHFILSQHAQGIQFREWNAGTKIDAHMKDEGFNIKITFDKETGLIFGGNQYNCGTWMDKMGSSYEAGTIGVPATPRDGAAVEIIGLLKSTLRFVTSLPSSIFEYDIANPATGMTYKEWNTLIEQSFEKSFYIGTSEENDSNPAIDKKLVNRTKLIKDTFGVRIQCYVENENTKGSAAVRASDTWRDYQLRPNCCVALSVAPELVSKQHALSSLETVSSILFSCKSPTQLETLLDDCKKQVGSDAVEVLRYLGAIGSVDENIFFTTQLGLKTLDPTDYNYRPNYNNGDRSTDSSVACGFNYHNGPEWIWPVGYFLDASFSYLCGHENSPPEELLRQARFYTARYLLLHRQHMATDPWISLPEVTDSNGQFCPFSCHAQAWSVGAILTFLSNIATASSAYVSTSVARTSSTLASPTGTPCEGSTNLETESSLNKVPSKS